MGRRAADLSGRTFGRLTVVGHAGRSGPHLLWECRCECGRSKVLSGRNLTGGTRSCGCLLGSPRDLAGQVFGHLTVLRLSDRRPSGKRLWECRCDCGRETTVFQQNLTRGSSQSCGCRQYDRTPPEGPQPTLRRQLLFTEADRAKLAALRTHFGLPSDSATLGRIIREAYLRIPSHDEDRHGEPN